MHRSMGLCGNALELASQSKSGAREKSWRVSPLIINDLLQDDKFKDQPFVKNHPSLRFYAAMAMTTKSGFNIGTLSIMDERSRNGLDAVEIEFLQDMALTVMGHLEMTRFSEGHRRSEKMIRGLSTFMEGRVDLDDWWRELGNKPQQQDAHNDGAGAESNKGKGPELDPTSSKGSISAGRTMRTEAPESFSRPPMATTAKVKAGGAAKRKSGPLAGGDHDMNFPVSESGRQESSSHRSLTSNPAATAASAKNIGSSGSSSRSHSAGAFTPDFQQSLVSKRLKRMFSQASHIIRESIEVDGAIFLDATVSTLSEQPGEPTKTLGLLNRRSNKDKYLSYLARETNSRRLLSVIRGTR